MNTPYIKEYDKFGNLLNPIEKIYLSNLPNRKQRREKPKKFYGESNNFHLTVFGIERLKRVKQVILRKDGTRKIIHHYIPC